MKKILLITSLYPNQANPTRGIFVKKQVEELAKRHLVKVFATESGKKFSYQTAWADNVELHQTRYNFPRYVISAYFYRKSIRDNLERLLEEFEPEIIHIHAYQHFPELYILAQILDFQKYKIVVTFHNNKQLVEIDSLMKYFYRLTLTKVIKKISNIIVVSDKVKNILLPYTSEPENIYVLGNGVETDYPKLSLDQLQKYLPADNESFKIISVGNLIPSKGFDLLIQAVSDLNQKNYAIDLTIVGAGTEKANLHNLIVANNMSDRIHLLGQVEHDIVMNLYKYFDAFVLPSWSETFGIVYLEAMLAKIPVIGVKGEGIDGIIIDNENGFLVEPRNINDLMNKIEYILSHKELQSIVLNAYNTVIKNYTLEQTVRRIQEIYEK